MSYSDDDDLQNTIMDLVNHTVVTYTNSPRVPSFEFLYVGRARIGFKSRQARKNPVRNFIR